MTKETQGMGFKLSGRVSLAAVFILTVTRAAAGDLGYRFINGACVNPKGDNGLNPSYIGQCADFRGAVLGGVDFWGIDFSGSNFEGAEISNAKFDGAKF